MPRLRKKPKCFEHPLPGQDYVSDIMDESPLNRLYGGPPARHLESVETEVLEVEEENEAPGVEPEEDQENEAPGVEHEEDEENEAPEVEHEEDEASVAVGIQDHQKHVAPPEVEQEPSGDELELSDEEDNEVSEFVFEDDPIPEPDAAQSYCRNKYNAYEFAIPHPMLFLAVLIAMAAVLPSIKLMSSVLSTPTTSQVVKPNLPPCFMTYPEEPTSEGTSTLYEWCDQSKDILPCPEGGLCSNGQLQSCKESYHLVSNAGNQCILSSASNETLAYIKQVLSERTSEHYCSLAGSSVQFSPIDTSPPFFDMARLIDVGSQNDVQDLLLSSNDFVFDNQNGTKRVGLEETIAWSIIPLTCRLRIYHVQVMDSVEEPVLYAFKTIPTFVWFSIKTCPLISIAVVVLLLAAFFAKRKAPI